MDVRQRIIQKASDLFMRYGIRSITMDEIAAQLGISKKTIYQFFTDKDDMVEAVIKLEIEFNENECIKFQEESENAVHEIFLMLNEMEEMLKSMNPLIMYDLEKHHPRAFRMFKDHKYQFMYKVIRANIDRGMQEEVYRADLNGDVIAKHRIESAFMAFNPDIYPHNRYKVSDICYELTMLFVYSITTVKGKKLIDKYSAERNKQLTYEQKTP